VSWERYAPEFGNLTIPESSYRHSFPLSIMINADGKRFVDEGIEFYNYTYAKYGAEVLRQPGPVRLSGVRRQDQACSGRNMATSTSPSVVANSLEELAAKLEGVNAEGFLKTVREYNAAVKTDVPFDHSIKDGQAARSASIRRSRTGRTCSTRRPSRPMRSLAASRSPLAA
jgi:tricarballylate dehydrogenase